MLDVPGPAGAADEAPPPRALARRGRDGLALAVRERAAVRLHRDVHVRGRHAERGAPRGRAVARPRPAARAARPGRAARPDRRGRARRGRGRPAAPLGPHARRLGRRARRRAAAHRRPDGRRGAGARAARPRGGGDARRRCSASAARSSCASAARSAGSPPTTPGSTATPSARCPPGGLPQEFLAETERPLERILARYARTRGPFTTAQARERYAVDPSSALVGAGARGRDRPRRAAPRRLRARVVRRARAAAPAARLARRPAPGDRGRRPHGAGRVPARAGRASTATRAAGAGIDRLREALVPLQGLALPAEVWERDVLPRRVGAYSPTWMDQLCASGEVVWLGAGALGPQLRAAWRSTSATTSR